MSQSNPGSVDQLDKLSSLLLALLDRIELEEDHTLAGQRHQIARDCGYTVVFGEPISGELHSDRSRQC